MFKQLYLKFDSLIKGFLLIFAMSPQQAQFIIEFPMHYVYALGLIGIALAFIFG